jgi:hypothetical protein
MNDCCPPNSKHRSDQQAHNAKCLLCDKTEYERGLCTTHYGRYHRAVQNLPLDQRESFEAAQIAAGKILPSQRGQGPRRKKVAPLVHNAKCFLCDKTEYERGLCTTHYSRYYRAVQALPFDQRESFEAAQIAAGKILPSRRGQGPRRKQVAPFEDNEWAEFPASTKQAMRGTSKRQRWKAATFYLKPETLAQLRRVILEWKLEGLPGDFSDAVEEALEAWLSQQDK